MIAKFEKSIPKKRQNLFTKKGGYVLNITRWCNYGVTIRSNYQKMGKITNYLKYPHLQNCFKKLLRASPSLAA